MLNINDQKIREIVQLADFDLPLADVQDFLRSDDEAGYLICDDQFMVHFLDGLIYWKRGRDDQRARVAFEIPVSNNSVLKKLRVAFHLKEDDMHELLEKGGYRVGRAELSAFLRKKDHSNYRECGDQVLRYFLKGLTLRLRG